MSGLLILLLLLIPAVAIARSRNRKDSNYDVIADSEYAPYAAWIVAQARHESANFSSYVYRTDNNPFGIKWYSDKVSMGTKGVKASDGGNYTHFENDTVAFKALLAWLRRHKIPTNLTTVDQYAQALRDEGYYTDSVSNYASALRRWLNYKP